MPIKVKAAGAWQTAAAKVKVAGTWKAARSWTKVSGTWRRDVLDFDLAIGNTNAFGIAWDGAYLYVMEHSGKKVYVYDADGNYQSDRELPPIAWDGAYLYVTDNLVRLPRWELPVRFDLATGIGYRLGWSIPLRDGQRHR